MSAASMLILIREHLTLVYFAEFALSESRALVFTAPA
jgi:hypothetical protein